MIDRTESVKLAEEIKTAPRGTKTVLKALLRQMKRLERLEVKINKLRVKGLYPGTPNDPITIG